MAFHSCKICTKCNIGTKMLLMGGRTKKTPLLEGALLLESNWQKNKCSTCKIFNFVAARVQILHTKYLYYWCSLILCLNLISYKRLEMKPSHLARSLTSLLYFIYYHTVRLLLGTFNISPS